MADQLMRDRVPVELTYDLSHIYPSEQAFEEDLARANAQLEAIGRYEGHLGEGPAALLALLRLRDELLVRANHLGAYARGHAQVDGTSPAYQAMSARVAAFGARMEAALAFIPTELLALPDGTVERYLAE